LVGSDPGIRTIVSKAQFKLSSVLQRDSSADVTVFWVGLMYLAGPFFSAVFAIAYAFLATKDR